MWFSLLFPSPAWFLNPVVAYANWAEVSFLCKCLALIFFQVLHLMTLQTLQVDKSFKAMTT